MKRFPLSREKNLFLCVPPSRDLAERGGHRSRKGRCDMGFEDQSIRQEQAQINITPLVDVLLVLLVIFMMTAPVLSRPIPLTLPQSAPPRSEEHTSELQSLMRISSAVFCLKKNNNNSISHRHNTYTQTPP